MKTSLNSPDRGDPAVEPVNQPPAIDRSTTKSLGRRQLLFAAAFLAALGSSAVPGTAGAQEPPPSGPTTTESTATEPTATEPTTIEDSRDTATAERFEKIYRDTLTPYEYGEITETRVLDIVRTSEVVGHVPQDEIPFDQPVKQGELVEVFFALTIPRGQAEPVTVSWEHNGKPYAGEGGKCPRTYKTQASWRYRLNTSAQFYEEGMWTFVVSTESGKELLRQNFIVTDERI